MTSSDSLVSRLASIRIVLSQPRDSKNVGAVCRAMKNMGLTRLYIAGCAELDMDQARVLAIHASDVLENAVMTSTLDEAVEGCTFIAGTTRRWGKHRKYTYMDPAELAERLLIYQGAEAAVVFGNEVSGLSDEEIQRCHVAVTIPSSADFPSLNLSHAVQIIAYEIYRTFHADTGRRFYTPISGERLDVLVDHVTGSLQSLGFFKLVKPEEMGRFIRGIFLRAALSRRESERIHAIFSKIAGMAGKKR